MKSPYISSDFKHQKLQRPLYISKGIQLRTHEKATNAQNQIYNQLDALLIKWAHIYNLQMTQSFPNELHLGSFPHIKLKYNKVSL